MCVIVQFSDVCVVAFWVAARCRLENLFSLLFVSQQKSEQFRDAVTEPAWGRFCFHHRISAKFAKSLQRAEADCDQVHSWSLGRHTPRRDNRVASPGLTAWEFLHEHEHCDLFCGMRGAKASFDSLLYAFSSSPWGVNQLVMKLQSSANVLALVGSLVPGRWQTYSDN